MYLPRRVLTMKVTTAMARTHRTIPKLPERRFSEDYVALRKRGIELIEKLGSELWTDYNIHDPGITLLELLCYAETEVGYKLGFSIRDLLEPHPVENYEPDLQCLFSAREIMTISPFTENDYRKLLIDLPDIRNAWLSCTCGCHPDIYADCDESTLTYSPTEHQVKINGFWDVRLELENDMVLGDLNSGKVLYRLLFSADGRPTNAIIELRFSPWHVIESALASYDGLLGESSVITAVSVPFITGNKTQVVDVPGSEWYRAMRDPLFATFNISYKQDPADPVADVITLDYVPIRIWYRNSSDREAITIDMIRASLEEATAQGPASIYLGQLKAAKAAVDEACASLQAHRNLTEDYCTVTTMPLEDIGFCADLEVEQDADIEAIVAQIYWEVSQYMAPNVPVYSLEQLLDLKMASEDIFNGPKLNNGFILNEDLDKAALRQFLYVSDIINIIMDIDGVVAVRNAALMRFDETGKHVESQPWVMTVTDGHLPRFYLLGSKVLVFKNELPFLPDLDELNDTLIVLQGQAQSNAQLQEDNDLPMPRGTHVDIAAYYPIQYNLPETYGVGPHGLPDASSDRRKAQSRQLKGYLFVFEYLLSTYIRQVAHLRDLLSISPSIMQTYYSYAFDGSEIRDYTNIASGDLDDNRLVDLLETHPQYLARRNGFLDHLMARFAESFADYALMLMNAYGSSQKAGTELIVDKINFLSRYPETSWGRARSIDYTQPDQVCEPEYASGLAKRIRAVLGFGGLQGFFTYDISQSADNTWAGSWKLKQDSLLLLKGEELTGYQTESAIAQELVSQATTAAGLLSDPATLAVSPDGGGFVVSLADPGSMEELGKSIEFGAEPDADAHQQAIIDFVNSISLTEKIFVVEHILLRPRSGPTADIPAGDPFLPICLDDDCEFCGEEDPYSYRITVVLNGESGFTNTGLAFRQFAERTIRLEIPAHVGAKICWVSEEQLTEFETVWCAWRTALANKSPDLIELNARLQALLLVFNDLKNVYPEARLHDCIDGDDENRVFLNKTVI